VSDFLYLYDAQVEVFLFVELLDVLKLFRTIIYEFL
jgi:hypothetical protein